MLLTMELGQGQATITLDRSHPLSGQSKALVRRFLIGALNHAVRLGYLKDNPAQKSLAPLVVRERLRVLDVEEALSLLANTENPIYRAMFGFQLFMGLRIGEVLGIRWTDVEDDLLHIRQQVQRDRATHKVASAQLKTDRSQRTLPIPPPLLELLAAVPQRGEYVFSTQHGTPLEPRNAQRALDASAKRAKLGKITTHSLRRTNATLLVLAGTDINIIRDQLGHTDLRTTTIYARTSVDALRRATDNITSILRKA